MIWGISGSPWPTGLSSISFEWGPYEPADYGEDIDWAWDPRGDIEWVAAMYRFHWAIPLASAYDSTRNEDYARAFVELTSDWIAKHPLEKRSVAHPVYEHWFGYPWLDIQTGIRATQLCRVFKSFVHAESFHARVLRESCWRAFTTTRSKPKRFP